MILVIDNYDSFVYNLVQYIGEKRPDVQVCRNDGVSIKEIRALGPTHIVLSPGPCGPYDAGISMDVVRQFAHEVPILGVCLGHQAIVAAMGGAIARAEEVRHGKTSTIRHDGKGIHRGLPNPFTATRYHSLVANRHALPASLSVSALSEDDEQVMAVESRQGAVYGVQYHPESIATEVGKSIVHNFLDMEHVVNA